jgi:hypothetical protein
MASGNEESRFPDPTVTIETDNRADELNICTEANNDLPQSVNWNNHEMKVVRGNQLLGVPRQIVYEPHLLLIMPILSLCRQRGNTGFINLAAVFSKGNNETASTFYRFIWGIENIAVRIKTSTRGFRYQASGSLNSRLAE